MKQSKTKCVYIAWCTLYMKGINELMDVSKSIGTFCIGIGGSDWNFYGVNVRRVEPNKCT